MSARTPAALTAVKGERQIQTALGGEQRHDFPVWVTVLTEEVGEFSQAVLKAREWEKDPTAQQLEWLLHQRSEALQCAAVAVAIVEHLDELIELYKIDRTHHGL